MDQSTAVPANDHADKSVPPASQHINAGDSTGSIYIIGDHNVIGATPATPQPPPPDVPTQPGSLPPGSHLPFTRNQLFTGREPDFARLKDALLSDQPADTLVSQNISGMGGIGKTQLAIEFAYRFGYQFKGVHWLDLRDPATLDSQIAQCGGKMALDRWSEKQPEQVALTLDAWKRSGPRLLILDNFEDPAAAPAVLSTLQHPNARILITTRRFDWPPSLGLRSLPLDVFTTAESIDFLRKYTLDRFSDDELTGLAERLGCLALALDLAGRYLSLHPHMAMAKYRTLLDHALEHESMRGFRKDLPTATGHELDMATTFSLSWQQVTDEPAQKVFKVAGYCAPNTAIPLEIFQRALDLDETACDGALHMLAGLGVVFVLTVFTARGRYTPEYFTPLELGGLYWHFVDIIWIFLYPLLYLAGPHR